ncbi:alpha-glucosidase [Butyrivibrio sp. AE2015]|uniref:alpha-glucosidase n=1 Tax=Butyrivibrio sp. AE2015 TaxID=1280663 RepID=UPI00040B4DE6|nr:alpha-glucosidase [Butyrivibrio sp. AE2015]
MKGVISINQKSFEQLELQVGSGTNDFKMSRGSFKYRQHIDQKIKLDHVSSDTSENVTTIKFKAAHSDITVKAQITTLDNGITKLSFLGDTGKFNRFWIRLKSNESEHIYGCGETYSKFDLKGEKVRIFVAEHQNANRIGKKIIKEKIFGKHPEKTLSFDKYESYYAQPTFVSSEKYFIHVDVSAYSEFDFRKKDHITLYTQETPVIYYYKAQSFEELSGKLSELLGHQRTLPSWVYKGAILAIQEGTEKIDEKIKKVEDKGGKVCGIWSQDWCGCRRTGFGYQVMWNWQWDKDLYHNLDIKIKEWKQKGIRFLGYINPFIALEGELYKTASKEGFCVKAKDGSDYLVTITTFPAAMVDFTNPKAYDWYKSLIKENMIGLGMGGWMADFGEYLPLDCVLFSGEDPQKLHNRWPSIWAQMNKEAIKECGVSDDVFFFTRAGHTGTISASAMMWTGDQHVDWSVDDGIASVIPATLSLAMSGYGLTHSDVGGYTTIMHMTRSKELLLRWEEMNVFSPLFRSHEGNQPSRNVQFDGDDELLEQLSRSSRLHERLAFYIKECVEENAARALPVMRPLFYHYDEKDAYTEKTEYLLGRDILVAPVLKENSESRNVYLPDDTWIHLFSKKEYKGGNYEIEGKVGMPPVFVRKNAEQFEKLIEVTDNL